MGNLFKDHRNDLEIYEHVVYYLTEATWKMLSTMALVHNYGLGATAAETSITNQGK